MCILCEGLSRVSGVDVCQGNGDPGDAQEAEGWGHLIPPHDAGASQELAQWWGTQDLLLLPQPVREREDRGGRSGHCLAETAGQ